MTELIVALSGNTVELHGTALLEVTARTAEGHVVTPPTDSLVFTSSDYGIALVSPQGVVYGGSRGTATIRVIYGGVSAGLTVLVRARLAVTLGEATRTTNFVVAVGDALPLVARFVDVNGVPVLGEPTVIWSSDNPAAVSVDQSGHAVALQPLQQAMVVATAALEGPATAHILVDEVSSPPRSDRPT